MKNCVKKIIIIGCIGTMMTTMFVGCGSTAETSISDSGVITSETSDVVVETETNMDVDPGFSVSNEEVIFDGDEVVLDNDICRLTVTKIYYDESGKFNVTFFAENKTDYDIVISNDNIYVNGLQVNDWYYDTIPAGMSSASTVWFTDDEYVDEYTVLELDLDILTADSYDKIDEEYITIYPYGADNTMTYRRDIQNSDVVIVDDDQFLVLATDFYFDDEYNDYYVDLYLENKTDKEVAFNIGDVSINNTMTNPLSYSVIAPNKVAYDSIEWFSSDLEESMITDIETICFELSMREYENYDDPLIYDATVILTPDGYVSVSPIESETATVAEVEEEIEELYENSDEDVNIIYLDDGEYDIIIGEPQGNGCTVDEFENCMYANNIDVFMNMDLDTVAMLGAMNDTMAFVLDDFDSGLLDSFDKYDLLVTSLDGMNMFSSGTNVYISNYGVLDNGDAWLEGVYNDGYDDYYIYGAIVGDSFIISEWLEESTADMITILRDLGF